MASPDFQIFQFFQNFQKKMKFSKIIENVQILGQARPAAVLWRKTRCAQLGPGPGPWPVYKGVANLSQAQIWGVSIPIAAANKLTHPSRPRWPVGRRYPPADTASPGNSGRSGQFGPAWPEMCLFDPISSRSVSGRRISMN